MSRDLNAKYDVERYRPLGLVANPFVLGAGSDTFVGADVETASEANKLLGILMGASEEATPKPVVVTKIDGVPANYPLRAIGLAERSLAADDGVGILHAYVQLFMMRLGRVRSIISVVAERLAFHDFDGTLAKYIETVLAQPDTDLTAYQLLGDEGLAAFGERFSADRLAAVRELFGEEAVERHPELREMSDSRAEDLPSNVDEDESDPEIDATVGDAPANVILLAEEDEQATESEDNDHAVVDYIIEHTKTHLSPVIARGLRVYRARGQMAMITELKVTKAPKKTLLALAKFANTRFKKVALIFDGFDGWYAVPSDLKAQIASTLSEVRWLLDHDAVMVLMLEQDRVPELAEQFSGGTQVEWAFGSLKTYEADETTVDADIVNEWLARATRSGSTPLTMADPVLSELASESDGFEDFMRKAATAIESAADRGVSALDDEALTEAKAATLVEANEE